MTPKKMFQMATVLAALFGLLTAGAMAQTLEVRDALAAPGQVAVVDVVMKDAPAGVAGVNFTLTLPVGNTVARFDSAQTPLVSIPAAVGAGWTVEENIVSDAELRAVLYNTNNPIQGWPAVGPEGVVIAQVKVSILPAAVLGTSVQLSINNALDPVDPGNPASIRVRKTAFSSAQGVSLKDGAAAGQNDTVTIGGPATISAYRVVNEVFDFAAGGTDAFVNKGWMAIQGYPTFMPFNDGFCMDFTPPGLGVKPIFGPTAGSPVYWLAFAWWQSQQGLITGQMVEDPNMLLRVRYNLATTETNPDNVPRYRLRLNASDETHMQLVEVFSPSDDKLAGAQGNGRLQPAAGAPLALDVYILPPVAARNEIDPKGYLVNFDVININPAIVPTGVYIADDVLSPEGTGLYLTSLEVKGATINPATFTPVAGASWDFTAAGADSQGWVALPDDATYSNLQLHAFQVDSPAAMPNTPTDTSFIGTVITGANNGLYHSIPQSNPTNTASGHYGFRIWQSPNFNLTPGGLYAIKFTVASPDLDPADEETALDPARNPHWRVRLFSILDGNQWNVEYFQLKKNPDNSIAPTPEGREYMVFFQYPTQLSATSPVGMAFDIANLPIHVNVQNDTNNYGAVKLLKAQVVQFAMPSFD